MEKLKLKPSIDLVLLFLYINPVHPTALESRIMV